MAVEEVIADEDDFAGGRGLDGCAGGHGEIQARVRVAFFAIEEAAHAELARQRAVDRLVQQQVARCVRAEGAVGGDLLGQFALDALEVALVWIDLLGVFQGDALFRVLLAANAEVEGATAAADGLHARLDR
ncbi:hypothetical protein D3C73_1251010 [compost metagenome]